MRKAFVAPTFHFKGSGWAKMDRRSASRSKKSEAEAGTSADSTTTASDAKPAADAKVEASGASKEAAAPSTTSDGGDSTKKSASPD
jgi:hypothetical protein